MSSAYSEDAQTPVAVRLIRPGGYVVVPVDSYGVGYPP